MLLSETFNLLIYKAFAVLLWRVSVILIICFSQTAFAATEYKIELQIPGFNQEDIQLIQEGLSLHRYRTSPFVTESYFINLQNKGIAEIRSALQTYGYYQADVTLNTVQNGSIWVIQYTAALGAPLKVDTVNINISGAGEADTALIVWQNDYPLHIGDTFTHTLYETAKSELLRILRTRGYFKHHIEKQQVQVSLKDNKADIGISVDTGARHLFGKITINSELYDSNYLYKFVDIKVGEPFQWQKIIDTQLRFSKSNEFLSIEIQPQLEAIVDLAVPLDIRLVPRKKWRYGFGLGYGTDVGVKVSANALSRRVTDTAHQAEFEASIAQRKQEIELSYRIPLDKPESDFFTLAYAYNNEETDTSISEDNSLKASISRDFENWKRGMALALSRERYEVGLDEGDSKLLVPSINFLYQSPKPNKDQIQSNLRFFVEIRGASTQLVSDIGFAQSIMDLRLKYPLSKSNTLVSRLKLGASLVNDFNELPASYRFFAGGDYSVRGYRYNTLGPVDENGETIGGENLAVGSVEFQHQFVTQWDIAAFYDIGNAFSNSDYELQKGAGIGVGKLFSFMSIRAYLANALSKEDKPWRFHLLIGAEI